MELIKKIFFKDDEVVGLCPFKECFVPQKVFVEKNDFPASKIVFSADVTRNPNIFAFAK